MRDTTALIAADDRVEVLRNIEVPDKFFNRIRFGVEVFDLLFGGLETPGLMPGSSMLFTGVPGAGKSTLCLQIADLIQRSGMKVLYNLGEENRYMVKMRADRLGCRADYLVSQKEDVNSLIKYVVENKIQFLIQDSLQTMQDRDLHGNKLLKEVTRKLHSLSKDHDVTVVMIGHVTKAGVFSGPNGVKHDTDAHAHLGLGNDGTRVLEMTKNRFGPAQIKYGFAFGSNGISLEKIDESVSNASHGSSSPPGGRRGEKRNEIKDMARDRLLNGEMLSGYCFERLGLDCSGGFWRGMIRQAQQELEEEGYGIGERKVNGRTHIYINRDIRVRR